MQRTKAAATPHISTIEIITELVQRRDQINAILSRHGYGEVPLDDVVAKLKASESSPTTPKRRGRPPKSSSVNAGTIVEGKPERKRGPKGSAATFLLSLLAEKPLATAEINTLWKRTRKGVSDNYLTNLTKSGQIKRSPNPSGRGSQYSLA
jgi:hypothetical protein